MNVTCVSDRVDLARELGSSPPNLTPLFNEIGTIAGARISPKRLVRYGNDLHYVIAGAQA